MTDRQDFVMIAMAVCVAGYIALAVDYVAHHDLGFSSAHIREGRDRNGNRRRSAAGDRSFRQEAAPGQAGK